MVEDHLGERRLGGCPSQRQLSAGSIPTHQIPAGREEGDLAVAASMLTAVYYMLRDQVEYKDLGAAHFDQHDRSKTIHRLMRRLQLLGCNVEVTAQPA